MKRLLSLLVILLAIVPNGLAQFGKVADIVDLGLSVKWASWNLGASSITDYGGWYGMGDSTGKITSKNESDYFYNGESVCGTEYDLARIKWGGDWRLPTSEELKELANKCSWVHNVTFDGVHGSIAKGPNGNSIFIPYAGARNGNEKIKTGKYASIWSGDPGCGSGHKDFKNSYVDLDINYDNSNNAHWDCETIIIIGQSIRPVYVEEKPDPFGKVADIIDLGLSVKWASWNIGASKVADYGGLYGAGDPTGLETSTTVSDYYFKDGESICGTEYDLAHVKWGSGWRMPKWSELEELMTKCNWTDGEINGVKGNWVEGPNGNSIFLPWAGNRKGENTFSGKGEAGHYWSGDMGVPLHSYGYKDFDNMSGGVFQIDGAENYWGQSIRPVYEEITFHNNGIIFTVKDDETLEVIGLEDGTTIVDILSTVTFDGKEYQVTSIGERAFEGRSDINYLSIPWSVTSIGEYAFIDCGSNMTVNIADPESWCQMELGNEHSSPLSSAGKVLVHDIETTIIDIPEGVTSIANFTFYQCRSITSLNIPATVTSIGSSTFEDCIGLTSLTLSEGLEYIGGSAFEGCTGLQVLTIPSTVNMISINAFKKCTGITDVFCYAEIVPETDENAFDGTPTEKSILHVPVNAIEAYRAAWPWSDFKEIVSLDNDDDWVVISDSFDKSIPFTNIRVLNKKSASDIYCCIAFSTSPNTDSNSDRYFINFWTLTIGDDADNYGSWGKPITNYIPIGSNWYQYEFSRPVYFAYYQKNCPRGQVKAYIDNSSSINNIVLDDEQQIDGIYDLYGNKLPVLKKGINIVRLKNGSKILKVIKN